MRSINQKHSTIFTCATTTIFTSKEKKSVLNHHLGIGILKGYCEVLSEYQASLTETILGVHFLLMIRKNIKYISFFDNAAL